MTNESIKSHAQVVVIGGGLIGCSVLYHLTKLGWKDVVFEQAADGGDGIRAGKKKGTGDGGGEEGEGGLAGDQDEDQSDERR